MTASFLSRIIARRNEIQYENNLNAAWKRGEEIAMVQERERITSTAILMGPSTPFALPLPASHYQVAKFIRNETLATGEPLLHEQGFVTSRSRFVDRKEAYRIAVAAGQIDPARTFNKDTLFSEDFERAQPQKAGSECNRSAMDQSAANEAATLAPEPSDGLTEEVLQEIDAVTQDCESPRRSCSVGVNNKTMRALVAAARERDQLRVKLAQAEKTIAARDEYILRVKSDLVAAQLSAYKANTQLLHILGLEEPPNMVPDQLLAVVDLAAKRVVELEQRIAAARKECEEALALDTRWSEFLPATATRLRRIATILEPLASGMNTKG